VTVRVLDLSGQQLTSVSVALEDYPELEVLRLDDNALSALPAAIGRLRRLTELHLRRNLLPEVPEALFLDGVKALLREDAAWLPSAPGTSLYVRPFIFATEPFLGVRPAKQVLFAVILSPVGGYFSGAARPLKK